VSTILLASGGTGGHLFPAQALAEALARRGHGLALATDRRGALSLSKSGGALSNVPVHVVSAGTLAGGIKGKITGIARIGLGLVQSRALLARLKPNAVVGFGGYPSVPVLWAAVQAGIPTAIHEQNAVLGRANRLLASRVNRIGVSFNEVAGLKHSDRARSMLTGNPVRAPIAAVGNRAYPAIGMTNGVPMLSILITGGSQGARVFGEVVPAAITSLPAAARAALRIAHQCRPEDLARAREIYAQAEVNAETATFFDNMPERLTAAHVVIGRAGASTVAELAAAGRPAILVPFPAATDDHQTANARALDSAGGAWLVPQPEFTAPALAARLMDMLEHPAALARAAAAARTLARPDAAERLADLVEGLTRRNGNHQPMERAA
jgi:UDP-N-acetylglucosamine--N-acetylmuramyl-(pentapeptide) pyrophosphoryl-undecaprenol N-acetylglucosamine transferase